VGKPQAGLLVSREYCAMKPTEVFARKASGLVRTIGVWDGIFYTYSVMSVAAFYFLVTFAVGLYPMPSIAGAVLIGWIPQVLVAILYSYLGAAIPRTGGDYVWVGRIFHPAVGFAVNFYFVMISLSWLGTVSTYMPWGAVNTVFRSYAAYSRNASYISIAQWLETAQGGFIFTVAALIVITIILITGTKNTFRFMHITFWTSFVATLAFGIYLFSLGSGGAAVKFHEITSIAPDTIVEAAKTAGYPIGPFILLGTALASAQVIQNLIGMEFCTYVAGEMKGANKLKTQIIISVAAVSLMAFSFFIIGYGLQYSFGSEFFNALSYLGLSGNKSYPLQALPSGYYFMTVFTTNLPFIFFVCIGCGLLGVMGSNMAWIYTASRNMFSWSLERTIPTRFSNLDKRFNAPLGAIVIVFIVSVIYLYITNFTTLITFYTYSMLGWFIAKAIVGLAAVVFPWRRRDLFEAAPEGVKRKVAGIPVVSILGVLIIISSMLIVYGIVAPFYVGPINWGFIPSVAVLFVIPVIIYGISYAYHKRRGIPMEVAHRELPPD